MSEVNVSASVVSEKGKGPESNEDNFYLNGAVLKETETGGFNFGNDSIDTQHVFAVCDGTGQKASTEAVRLLSNYHEYINYKENDLANTKISKLHDIVYEINNAIQSIMNTQYDEQEKAGTTLSCLLMFGNEAYVINVGNSRVYILKDTNLNRINIDKLFAYKNVQLEHSDNLIEKNNLVELLGESKNEKINIRMSDKIILNEGDVFLLCSEGLFNYVYDDRIREILRSSENINLVSRSLVKQAILNGGDRDTTALVIKINSIANSSCVESIMDSGDCFEVSKIQVPIPQSFKKLKIATSTVVLIFIISIFSYINGRQFCYSIKDKINNFYINNIGVLYDKINNTNEKTNNRSLNVENIDKPQGLIALTNNNVENIDKPQGLIVLTNNPVIDCEVQNTDIYKEKSISNAVYDRIPKNVNTLEAKKTIAMKKKIIDIKQRKDEAQFVQHRIKPGDTLFSITYKYYKTLAKYKVIMEYNGIKNKNMIKVGQVLKIPGV